MTDNLDIPAVLDRRIPPAADLSRLQECEQIIERGLNTFVEVGNALIEIRDSRLYRVDFSTFEDYCQTRWGFGRHFANRTIQAAQAVGMLESLVPIGTKPQNEAQARELAPLLDEPEKMAEAWEEASADGEPTAEKVRTAVQKRMDVHFSSATDEWATPQDLLFQTGKYFPAPRPRYFHRSSAQATS